VKRNLCETLLLDAPVESCEIGQWGAMSQLEQRYWLLVLSEGGYHCEPLGPGSLTFGRSRSCEICVNDASISRRHARLDVEPSGLWLTDLGSANGTRIRDELLVQGERYPIQIGETVKLGRALLIVQDFEAPLARPRGMLGVDEFRARVEHACQLGERSQTPFTICDIDLNEVPSMVEAFNALSPALEAADAIGQLAPRRWTLLFSGSQAVGQADLIRGVLPTARVGQAHWPADGRDVSTLLSRAVTSSSIEAPDVVYGSRMKALVAALDRVASSELTVLILGETGVGKEVLAERVHRMSPRRRGSLIKINCGALNGQLLESELFGHQRGAFTSADRDKPGLLELADGGTVFLDEIGELEVGLQVKLLRVLEERQVWRVGSTSGRLVDVRFVVATNRNLDQEIAAGRFRSDLFFRISGATFEIPPLRERPDEVEEIAARFLAQAARRNGEPTLTLSPASRRILRDYSWPGNIRELRNVIERATVLCDGPVIEPHHFPIDRMQPKGPFMRDLRDGDDGPTLELRTLELNRDTIVESLSRHQGNQSSAAASLGIHRRTLMRKMDQFQIPRPRKK
jgi:DNA-binding NtrC family response regulator